LENTTTSAGISVWVDNVPLQTTVLVSSNGATLSGSAAVLDASATGASDITAVQFVASGGLLHNQVVGTARLTLYGWIALWNTTGLVNWDLYASERRHRCGRYDGQEPGHRGEGQN
jgi:hypothetical protein